MRTRPEHRPFGRASTSDVLVLWAPTAIGVVVALTLFAAVALTARGAITTEEAAPQASIDYSWTPPPALDPPPPLPNPPPTTPSPAVTPSRTPGKAPTTRPPTTAPPRTTPPPAPVVTGRYRVLNSYGDSFIGEVLVSNASGQPRDWTVRLQFPPNVGRLRTAWVEGAPQATMRQVGSAYIFTSGVAVPARSSVPLRFHFDRWGRDNNPAACTVNDTPCN